PCTLLLTSLPLPSHDSCSSISFLYFYRHSASDEICTLSLPDALPICLLAEGVEHAWPIDRHPGDLVLHLVLDVRVGPLRYARGSDRKSTRLNSSHEWISYAVFCLKKKKTRAHSRDGLRSRQAHVRERV